VILVKTMIYLNIHSDCASLFIEQIRPDCENNTYMFEQLGIQCTQGIKSKSSHNVMTSQIFCGEYLFMKQTNKFPKLTVNVNEIIVESFPICKFS
jgi:hypothetical protein